MITRTDIENLILAWFQTVTELNTIVSRQPEGTSDAPRPAKPYATIYLGSRGFFGMRDELLMPPPDNPSILMTQRGQRELRLNCQTFGANAEDYLEVAIASLSDPNFRETYLKRAQELVFQVITGISDTYSFELAGVPFSFDGTGLSASDIAAALVTLIESSPYLPPLTISYTPGEDHAQLEGEFGESFQYNFPNENLVLTGEIEGISISPLRYDDIIDLSEILETTWEERSSVDLYLHFESKIWRNPGVIEKVEGEILGRSFSIGG